MPTSSVGSTVHQSGDLSGQLRVAGRGGRLVGGLAGEVGLGGVAAGRQPAAQQWSAPGPSCSREPLSLLQRGQRQVGADLAGAAVTPATAGIERTGYLAQELDDGEAAGLDSAHQGRVLVAVLIKTIK